MGAGTCVSVIGPNGAGKTTLLRAIVGLVTPSAGSIRLQDTDLAPLRTDLRARAGIALVPEGRGLLGSLTVEENLLLGGYTRGDALGTDLARVYELLPILKSRSARRAQFLSGGELQFLALGRALMSRPKIMLLDEPSMGLAPKARDSVLDVLQGFKQSGLSMLLIEQNVYLAFELADEVHKLEVGRSTFAGSPERLRAEQGVEAVYFGGG